MTRRVVRSHIDMLLANLKKATESLTESLQSVHEDILSAPVPKRTDTLKGIVHLLMQEVERRYGIAPGSQVERKLGRIFATMTHDDLQNWSLVLLSPAANESEWLSLVECLTVHETYFDRDREQLGILGSDILPRMIERKQRSGDHTLRIWSAGCSSGEEAYNLTMIALLALKNAGFACERADGSLATIPGWNLSVLGTDISSQMIRIAKSGAYSTMEMGSFRNMNSALWRFFEETTGQNDVAEGGRTMRVSPGVSGLTRFLRHNLLEPLPETQPFDLILCRNVLIYFQCSKKVVQELLCRKLASGGTLMLGATDVMLHRKKLEQHQSNGIFWYVKIEAGADRWK